MRVGEEIKVKEGKQWVDRAYGSAGSLQYIATTMVGAIVREGYSSVSQTVSESFAIDAPSKSIDNPLLITYGNMWIAFGVGVWQSAGRKRRVALRVCDR
jgi:hypothetical protein